MSRTRRLGLAAYRRLIDAVPQVMTDAVDNRIAPAKGRRAHARDMREAALWGMRLPVPSAWYATDGSGGFYLFRRHKVDVDLVGYPGIGRIPVTVFGTSAAQAYALHGGQLTDRRPTGWISAATMAGVTYGGLEGGPRDWGWRDDPDLDLDIDTIERLRAHNPSPSIHGRLADFSGYAAEFGRALAGVR